MSNPALQWISEAYTGGYLRAAFVDCQNVEFKSIGQRPFDRAYELSKTLREFKVPVSHFLFDHEERMSLKPFQYGDGSNIPYRNAQFYHVTPSSEEWVFPKHHPNGFTNPFAKEVVGNVDRHTPAYQKSVLITAGFRSTDCLMRTTIGSFAKAANPELHYAAIVLDATNMIGTPKNYAEKIRREAGPEISDRIGFAYSYEVSETLQTNPSQSSQPRPYKT
jgi:hypothetical protein